MTEQDEFKVWYDQYYQRFLEVHDIAIKKLYAEKDQYDPEQRWFVERALEIVKLQKEVVYDIVMNYTTSEQTVEMEKALSQQLDAITHMMNNL